MPKIDFSTAEDLTDGTLPPRNQYSVQVDGVSKERRRGRPEMWRLTLQILSGDYKDLCFHDHLVFSEIGLRRVKLLCEALGLDVSGDVDLTPDLILGRTCLVTIDQVDFFDSQGRWIGANVVLHPTAYEPMEGREVAGDGHPDL